MPAADPALGLSGAMASREQTRMTAEPVGGGELARAARSLESVQGNVAGQTMAIQSLSMATQSAVLNVGAQMNALSSQIASLNSSLSRLAGGMAMGAMPPPPPPMMMSSGGGGGFQMPSFAPMAGSMAMGAMGAMGTVGAGLGYMGGSMMSPLVNNMPVTRTPYGAEMSQNASAYQAMMLGSGIGVGRSTMRNMNYDRAVGAGRERFGDMVGAASAATTGGAASLGLGLTGEFIGSRMILPAMGYSGSGLVGGLAGSLIGGAVMAPATMALQQTMEQTAQINQLGGQYGRNAFRMGRSRPSREDRSSFGRAGLDIAIQDMTMTSQDVTEITAGMFNNDLTRGVRGTQEASDRLRELSRSVKVMARSLGGSYGEMMQTAGELQSIGMNINPQTTRRAVFGAGSVFGMSGKEGMAAGMGLAQPFVGMGMGAQGFGMGLAAQNLANYGIQTGALSPELAAAVGGKEGAAAMMQQGNLNFLRGGGGMAMLAGGMGAGGGFGMGNLQGLGMNQILGRGGQNMTPENLLRLGVAPQQLMRQAAESPEALLAQQLSQTISIAENMGIDNDMGRMAIFGQMTGKSGAELEAAWALAKESPAAARSSADKAAKEASSAFTSDVVEQKSLSGRFKRWGQRLTQPKAEAIGVEANFFANQAEGAAESIGEAFYGTKKTIGMGEVTVSQARRLREAQESAAKEKPQGRVDKLFADRQQALLDAADVREGRQTRGEFEKELESRKKVNKAGVAAADKILTDDLGLYPEKAEKLASIKARLADESDPEAIRKLAQEATEVLGDMYSGSAKGPFEVALSKHLGIPVTEALAGRGRGKSAITDEMKEKNQEDLNKLQKLLRQDEGLSIFGHVTENTIKKALASPQAREFMKTGNISALKGLDKEQIRILRAASESGAGRRVVEHMELESAEKAFDVGASSLASKLSRAGLSDKDTGLSRGGAFAAEALSKLDLSSEEIEKLKEEGLSEGAAKALGLKSGALTTEARKTLSELVTDPRELKRIMSDNELSPEELADIRKAQQSAVLAGEISTVEGQGVTQNQAQLLGGAMAEYRKLTEQVIILTQKVDKLRVP